MEHPLESSNVPLEGRSPSSGVPQLNTHPLQNMASPQTSVTLCILADSNLLLKISIHVPSNLDEGDIRGRNRLPVHSNRGTAAARSYQDFRPHLL